MSDDGSYEVGYGKPPRHTQFKPGNAGRRKGAAKKPKTVSAEAIVADLLKRKIRARRGDTVVEVGIVEVLSQRLMTIASQGNPRQVSQLLAFIERFTPVAAVTDTRLDIVHHQAATSTVPLPPADLWDAEP